MSQKTPSESLACEVEAPNSNATQIEDVQSSADTRQVAINRVGIKDIKHPIRVHDTDGTEVATVANVSMFVNLEPDVKGTHMSRFVEILNDNDKSVSVESLRAMLHEVAQRLESRDVFVELNFPYFINKQAPVSRVSSLMDYDVTLSGTIDKGKDNVYVKVVVPVTSLCPCSKKISEYGAHNQRSHVTVTVKAHDNLSVDQLIKMVESEASCELYGLLKRPDEKFITEYAYDNPKFVEDLVRDIAVRLNADDHIDAYKIESENFESIHNHSAYACIEFDKQVGR
ncbi:MAG: GTP cyclohydrolase I FolE2 [Gammaproteobacteria bacterium]|nr:MAG: GTP cyclohydrolase I FolE2 [Gammaproteobacteria bacterium]